MRIPFNKVYAANKEEQYVLEALRSGAHCGNHSFCNRVIDLIKNKYQDLGEIYLTPSCTAALEMGAVLADISPGDEVILPSYTFSSTVNAVILFGAKPVFCEVDPETMNIDPNRIEELITEKTKMILPIDYAGLSCEIDKIMDIANRHNLIVMQDCAQSFGSTYKGKSCGSQAHLAAYSFHETKNYNAGEGGGLVVNVKEWEERAYFLQEKGTDRRLVLNGVKNKYSWVDKGSSYLLSDILAAVLLAQLESEDEIRAKRSKLTEAYFKLFDQYVKRGKVRVFQPTADHELNHHAFWAVFDSVENKNHFMLTLKEKGISAYIGYLPLHSSPMGMKLGYRPEDLPLTEELGDLILRMPFYTDLAESGLEQCMAEMEKVLTEMYPN
ncbi:dTDP-4-amino-4,6-dideoxygalactose transaminase [Roseivirga misakiensis]|uniref:dTDP-4-amino-4,6-dideoxygalactose transaminase n=1 Tax=Roseivirga misakiensis TaxID=1563681 RepID=A0A1E5T650_9BACT|nr:dTDP-4-amino-4,6-dideoxygalactose transaminase [Roseivirga misakiensis]OEK06777.1 dTDP-4-amino-4,6-dideoxygalactose transaminase [Roseivirga misakiensis]